MNLPKRSTTAFSHSSTMCTDEDASHPTMAALTRATRPISANAACAAASTMPNASTNTTTANTTAPLREARLRLVTERMPSGGAAAVGIRGHGARREPRRPDARFRACSLVAVSSFDLPSRSGAAFSLRPAWIFASFKLSANCCSMSSSDMPSSKQRLRYSLVTISAVDEMLTPGLSDTSRTNAALATFGLDVAVLLEAHVHLAHRVVVHLDVRGEAAHGGQLVARLVVPRGDEVDESVLQLQPDGDAALLVYLE